MLVRMAPVHCVSDSSILTDLQLTVNIHVWQTSPSHSWEEENLNGMRRIKEGVHLGGEAMRCIGIWRNCRLETVSHFPMYTKSTFGFSGCTLLRNRKFRVLGDMHEQDLRFAGNIGRRWEGEKLEGNVLLKFPTCPGVTCKLHRPQGVGGEETD